MRVQVILCNKISPFEVASFLNSMHIQFHNIYAKDSMIAQNCYLCYTDRTADVYFLRE